MSKVISPRVTRAAAGLAVLSAFAVMPMAARANIDTTDALGTLTGGSLTVTAPDITPFGATLTGITQTVTTDVSAWNVTDATGSDDGYSITVSASAPAVAGGSAGTGGSMTLTPTTASAAAGNPATTGPDTKTAQLISGAAATISNAAAGSGQGSWNYAAGEDALSVVIPGNASAGAYSSTLTYTTAVPVGV